MGRSSALGGRVCRVRRTMAIRCVGGQYMSCGIRLDNLCAGYDQRPALEHVSGTFEPGTLTAVIGANGAGKTTLLKAIAGMLAPTAGHVDRSGLKTCHIAYLPQQVEIDRSFPISVLDTVMLGHWCRVGAFKAITGRLRGEARQALEAVGLGGFEKRAIGALSAGQFQRMLFARVLLQDCSVILLDEPFNAIDAETTEDLLDVVHGWHREQRTVIAVLHDLEQVRAHFPQTLLLDHEAVAWGDTTSVLQSSRLARPDLAADNRAATVFGGHRASA